MSTSILDINGLRINGASAGLHYVILYNAITSITMKETINGASTLEISLRDPDKTITRSGIIAKRVGATLDGAAFELCATSKSGNEMTLTFEDAAVAALRRHTSYMKVSANTMSRVDFCRKMFREESWIKVRAAKGSTALVELARGTTTSSESESTADGGEAEGGASAYGAFGGGTSTGVTKVKIGAGSSTSKKKTSKSQRQVEAGIKEPESSWDAATKIMGEINWRVFSWRGLITIAPDKWLISNGVTYSINDQSAGVDRIDWSMDVGKPVANATLTVRCGSTVDLKPGSRVVLSNEGPANGDWVVEDITRTTRSNYADVTLSRPQNPLAEPEGKESSTDGDNGENAYGTFDGTTSSQDKSANTGTASTNARIEEFVQLALAQKGKPYVWGGSGPNGFDCSGLVQWCASKMGHKMPKPVSSQIYMCNKYKTTMTVSQALKTRGALLFRGPNEHVAISLGNGSTMEARGRQYGCCVVSHAASRKWTSGGMIP